MKQVTITNLRDQRSVFAQSRCGAQVEVSQGQFWIALIGNEGTPNQEAIRMAELFVQAPKMVEALEKAEKLLLEIAYDTYLDVPEACEEACKKMVEQMTAARTFSQK